MSIFRLSDVRDMRLGTLLTVLEDGRNVVELVLSAEHAGSWGEPQPVEGLRLTSGTCFRGDGETSFANLLFSCLFAMVCGCSMELVFGRSCYFTESCVRSSIFTCLWLRD
jgi:hypothetical protein